MTAANGIEADIIESILRSYNIPVLRKYKGAGRFMEIYMGMTNTGIEFYVPSELLEKAKELLDSKPVCEEDISDENNESEVNTSSEEVTDIAESEKVYQKRRQSAFWIILLIIFIPGLVFIIVSLVTFILQVIKNGF